MARMGRKEIKSILRNIATAKEELRRMNKNTIYGPKISKTVKKVSKMCVFEAIITSARKQGENKD